MKKTVIAVCLAAIAASVTAADVTVSTVAELVNAVATASGGSKIYLNAGTYDLSLVEPQNPMDAKGVASIFINNKGLHLAGSTGQHDGGCPEGHEHGAHRVRICG